MKKRITAFLLAAALALACALPALASSGFSLATIQNGKDICAASEGTWKGASSYRVESFFDCDDNIHVCSGDLWAALCPFVFGYDKYGGFGIGIVYIYDPAVYSGGLYINELTVKVDGTSYTFTDAPSTEFSLGSAVDKQLGSWKMRCAYIALDSSSLGLMDALVKNRESAITARIKSADGRSWSFALSKTEKDSDVHIYNLFAQAGGLQAENLKFFPSGGATPCEIKKD